MPPVHPDTFSCLCFSSDCQFDRDQAFPVGCSVLCAVFESFRLLLQWDLHRKTGLYFYVPLFGWFFKMGPDGLGTQEKILRYFVSSAMNLGVPLAKDLPCHLFWRGLSYSGCI